MGERKKKVLAERKKNGCLKGKQELFWVVCPKYFFFST